MAFVRIFKIKPPLIEVISARTCLTLNSIVAEVMIYANIWSADWAIAMLISITIIGALFQLI